MKKVFTAWAVVIALAAGLCAQQDEAWYKKKKKAAFVGGGAGTSVVIKRGQMMVNPALVDSGNALLIIANKFTTPTPSSGGISVISEGMFVGSPAASNWGLAIYSDSSGPSALVSNCATFSSSTPSTGQATLTPSGCTLSAATTYWIAFVTASNTQQQIKSSNGPCDSSTVGSVFTGAIASFTSSASWPGTFPTNDAGIGNPCEASFVTLQYTTTATYVVAGSGTAACAGGTSCLVGIAAAGTGNGLGIANMGQDLSGSNPTVSSFADSASDTIPRRGTCTGSLTISQENCIGTVDRVTAGVNTLTVNYAAATLSNVVGYVEIIGTLASGSFDQAEYDTTLSATPFTSGNTGTTGQANEFLFGIANNNLHNGVFSAGGSWTILGQATTAVGTDVSGAIFFRIVNSTGAYNLQGSYSTSGTQNLPALVTLK